jgi:1,4-alpha-glucan branching enzyme
MEVRCTIGKFRKLVRFAVRVMLIICIPVLMNAQDANKYFIKNGKMYITLNKRITEASLDSFIRQYNLTDLGLKEFIRKNLEDSLRLMGWKIEMNNELACLISKSLLPVEGDLKNPADKILFTEKQVPISQMFPATNNGIRYGFNRFKNKDFLLKDDSVVIIFLRNYPRANKVMLAGSFNDWNPDVLPMKKTDSGWIAPVKLGPGKYWYKFIVDGTWIIDPVLFTLSGFSNARNIYLAGSFNAWNPRNIPLERSGNSWIVALYLPEGTHTYKYVVDGKWYSDEKNPNRYPDEFGGYNSMLTLGKPTIFTLKGYENAKRVMLAGSFNSWREDELYMKKTATGWEFPYVLGPGNYEYRFVVDGKRIGDPANPVSNTNGSSYVIVNPNYTFRLKGFSNAQRVYLAGDFNNWNPTAFLMKRQGDEWVFTVNLTRGKQRYKFIVDGNWILDPNNKLWEQNEHNTGNSIVWIGDNN